MDKKPDSPRDPMHPDVHPSLTLSLGRFGKAVDQARLQLSRTSAVSRIWRQDHTVWKPVPTEIANRLGWLSSPEGMVAEIPRISDFVRTALGDGFTSALLLGMGGSSLAPEVFARTFGTVQGHLELGVLDSTDPAAVLRAEERYPPGRTLYLVSTKSGTTPETLSFFKHFFNRILAAAGPDEAGKHFAAITDPGSPLERLAAELRFRETFLNDPNIGGRYSALSFFGLVPAALLGVDIARVLERASAMAASCGPDNDPVSGNNTGALLGAVLGTLAMGGVDKVTFAAPPSLSPLGGWLEQLLAESTGKEGTGILPVDGEALAPPGLYGKDRLFVSHALDGGQGHDPALAALESEGHPVVRIGLSDPYDLGGEFFRWEMATAIAGAVLGINPFDQPNVESAKVQTRRSLDGYRKSGRLPTLQARFEEDGLGCVTDVEAGDLGEALRNFLGSGRQGDYVCLQAFLDPTPEAASALDDLRLAVRHATRLATTLGYGPRFLHSTGQLHKGDRGNGLFLQIVSADPVDVAIPDEAGSESSSMTFGTLKAAQALGDRQALLDAGRRVFRVDIQRKVTEGIERLTAMVKGKGWR